MQSSLPRRWRWPASVWAVPPTRQGGAYVIQASTNLVDWFTVETNSPFTGNLIFSDPDATHFHQRFYRCQIFD
jgi:hypothetical protein